MSFHSDKCKVLSIVWSQLNHCCVAWRPTSDTTIRNFESIQIRAVKWMLNEEYHHYSDLEYMSRLKDLNLLPIKYFFVLNDLIKFHKIYNNNYCLKLPPYYRPYDDNDRSRLRSTIAPTDFYNSQRQTLDLNSMRAVSHDYKSLKCILTPICPVLKKSFFLEPIYFGIIFPWIWGKRFHLTSFRICLFHTYGILQWGQINK